MTTMMHAPAASPHPLGLSPAHSENLTQHLRRLRVESAEKARRLQDGQKRLLDFDPKLLVGTYAMIVEGHCMAPEINDGERVIMDSTAPWAEGDIVAVCLHKVAVQPGWHQVLIKRLIRKEAEGAVLATNQPGRPFFVPWIAMKHVHKVIGAAPASKASVGGVLSLRSDDIRSV